MSDECEIHGDKFIMYRCPTCGAPVCCTVCCKEAGYEYQIAHLERRIVALEEALENIATLGGRWAKRRAQHALKEAGE